MAELGFLKLKVVALAASDLPRARAFYGETLALPAAFEGSRQVGYRLGDVIVMLKPVADGWYANPTTQLNPRITFASAHAPDTERELTARGVRIGDPVQAYADEGFYVGSFLDSEGNKIWYCSPLAPRQA
jgi:catechol 2,3-dioxygenase-like lactoylglutathione lyase family enzyme